MLGRIDVFVLVIIVMAGLPTGRDRGTRMQLDPRELAHALCAPPLSWQREASSEAKMPGRVEFKATRVRGVPRSRHARLEMRRWIG